MKLALVCFTLAVVLAIANARSREHSQKWAEFKSKHGKKYASKQEEDTRFNKFSERLSKIEEHNKKFEKGEVSWHQSHNHLTDKLDEEISNMMGSRNHDPIPSSVQKRGISTTCYRYNSSSPCFYMYTADSTITRPASVDLRTTGWNEAVRNQGQCGSCWTFASSSVHSFYYYNLTKVNQVFSTQNLVDCAGIWGSKGCNGGSPAQAFEYIQVNKQNLEADYVYQGVQKLCTRPTTSLIGAIGFVQISKDQASLEQALYKLGAVVISVHADLMLNYAGGIWDGYTNGVKCDPAKINHAVTAIGYGVDSTTKVQYWLIKNSWGTTWGEKGFIRMLRSSDNLCGIYSYAYALHA